VNKLRDKKVLTSFGDHVRKLRKSKNLSLEKLAFEAEIELSQIYRLEKGIINSTLSTLIAISKALGISLKELMDF
jgi:transcriptional regulator with XRE-family HTH domain